jgi:hypothetical protein
MFIDAKYRVVLEGAHTRRDFFEIENVTYQALPLDSNDSYKGLGINSSVFRAVCNGDDETITLIVKVCNFADEIVFVFM